MRRILFNTFAAAAALTVSFGAMAQGVVGSNHDMTAGFTDGTLSGGFNTGGRVCIYCHVPHQSRGSSPAPLWNREDPTSTYTMYDSVTMDMVQQGQPAGVSLACLSCHDGTVAVDALYSQPWAFNPPDNHWTSDGNSVTTWGNLGTDLSTEHPISLTYDPAQDDGFNPAVDVETAGLRFFGAGGDQMECASCHDVHYTDGDSFWIDNDASALCRTCHIK